MLTRLFSAAVLTLSFASAASAHCGPCNNSAYSYETQNGVSVMRGKIPNINNPRNALAADRRAAEQRADQAERRALRAERAVAKARAEREARPMQARPANRNRSSQRYSSGGGSGFGFSVSDERGFRGRGKGQGTRGRGTRSNGGKSSGAVFSRGIRG